MATLDPRNVHVSLQIEGVDPGALRVSSVRIDEAIQVPRHVQVELIAEPGALQPAAMLRKGAQLAVTLGDAVVRRFEGVVLRVREVWRGSKRACMVTIGSPLQLLALSTDCRIFQDMTVPDIVEKVLVDAGFPAARIVRRLTATYPKLPSCTQYGETMLAFVSRLLEAEGAFYFLEDGPSGLDLVIGDSKDAHRAASPAKLGFVVDRGMMGDQAVLSLSEVSSLRPSKVTLRDLDWQKPELDLEATSEQATARARELYDHPGGYVTPAEGKKRAKVRLEALVAAASSVRGVATAPGLAPGHTFELEDGPRDDLSREWLVTEVVHAWGGETGRAWTASFRAIPKSVPYRPMTSTPRPRIAGPHTAIVTGPSGQEIHTDEHGRVRLKFVWDRRAKFDEKSSPWVRVAQLAMSGAMEIPRIGWEVLVEFEHGDPDRPVVVGRLYNATYLPPYPLPAKKTVSTLMSFSSPKGEGHNEIRIEDAAGAEHIHVHAQRDLGLTVAHDRTAKVATSRMVTIKADEAVTVKGNRRLEVKGLWETTIAGSQTLSVDGKRSKTVKKDEKVTVNGDRKLTVDGAHTISTEANATSGAAGDMAATITGTLTESADEATSIVIGDDMSLVVGGAKSETAKKGKSSTTDGKRSLTVGGAMVDVSGKDLSVLVGGKKTTTVGAAWTVTSGADIQLSSRGALEITVGGALTMTGATGISFKVGGSKVLVGQGGVTIETKKLKIVSDGPAAVLGAMVGSK
jgi:type VI secretion system secreted protein VgrG